MPFVTRHDVARGLWRLLAAPRDLPASAPWTDPPITRARASSAHRALFVEYLEYMHDAMALAETWWAGLIQAARESGLGEAEAVKKAYTRRFAGPVTRPEIVWTIRTFWLRCVEINHAVPDHERVPPEVFLLHWLADGEHDEWVQVLTAMPYWPMGLDEDGNWV